MEKNRMIKYLLPALFLVMVMYGCTTEDREPDTGGDGTNALILNYEVEGSMQTTRAVTATDDENDVDHIYTLFFKPSSSGVYVGHTRTNIKSTVGNTVNVSMPANADVDDAYWLVFIANLDGWIDLSAGTLCADTETWLNTNLAGKTLATASKALLSVAKDEKGIIIKNDPTRPLIDPSNPDGNTIGGIEEKTTGPLLMSTVSGSNSYYNKPASSRTANVVLKRVPVRVDVEVASGVKFEMISAEVWNARANAQVIDGLGLGTGATAHYKSHVVPATSNKVIGQLYAHPTKSASHVNGEKDVNTTCLIIGGKYDGGSAITYYRINVMAAGTEQNLVRNTVYKVNISKVHTAGSETKLEAYQNAYVNLEYSLTSWDNEFKGNYTYDADGNALGVSHRELLFAGYEAGETTLTVYPVNGTENPIVGDFTVSMAANPNFSVTKGAGNTVIVKALAANTTVADYNHTFDIKWGGITVAVKLKQLIKSTAEVSKAFMYFPGLNPVSQELCLMLSGDYAHIPIEKITWNVYDYNNSGVLGTSPSATNFEVVKTSDASGKYYFDVRATKSSSSAINSLVRFNIENGDQLLVASVRLSQGVRTVTTNIYEMDSQGNYTIDRGDVTTKMLGLPVQTNADFHLHFPAISHDQYQYKIKVLSTLERWKLVATANALSYLDIDWSTSAADGYTPAHAQAREIKVTAKGDIDFTWQDMFYIEFESGNRIVFTLHQKGVLGAANISANVGTNYINVVYYDVIKMDGYTWLDRNLGAESSSYYNALNAATTGWGNVYDGSANSLSFGGYDHTRAVFSSLGGCPKGFGLPRLTLPDGSPGEMMWLYANLKHTGVDYFGKSGLGLAAPDRYNHVFYIPYMDNGVQQYYYFTNPKNPSLFMADGNGYLSINSSNAGTKTLFTEDTGTAGKYYMRCVKRND